MTPESECHYAECLSFLNGMLSVIMLNVIMLSAIAPSQHLKRDKITLSIMKHSIMTPDAECHYAECLSF
jgi:hypothetical protein